jgi:hypothetical protein
VIGIAMDVTNEAKVEAVWKLRNLRSNLRLVSALTMLAFVVCHLTAHGFLLISFERAEVARNTAVATASTVGIALFISQVLSEFCAEPPLDQRLLELLEQPILASEILGLGIVGK